MSSRLAKGKSFEKEAYDLLNPRFFTRLMSGGSGDTLLARYAYNNAAIEYKAAGRADDALRCLEKVCAMAERSGALNECVKARVQMAVIYDTMKKDFESAAKMYLKNSETYLVHGKSDDAVKCNMKASNIFNKNGKSDRAFKIVLDSCALLEKEELKIMRPEEIFITAIRTCLSGKPRRLDTAIDLVKRLQSILKQRTKGISLKIRWRLYLSESILICAKDPDGVAAKLAMEMHMKETEYCMSPEYESEKEIVESILEEDGERLNKLLRGRSGALSSLDNSIARVAMELSVKSTIRVEDEGVASSPVVTSPKVAIADDEKVPDIPKVEDSNNKIENEKKKETNVLGNSSILDTPLDAPYISDSDDE